ncbi:putative flagellar basal-body rod protein FlgG [Magnetofaba australis IT-1]|uniref:Flagellar basal-body rod protein FlgG n=2 Tax=Magnetofaba TaxID=1472292 RepID=A0A1Y2K325_9PROT|nr:putative flagellar basal-body rod protein FlgG [Magnetofaba australis IT-1]
MQAQQRNIDVISNNLANVNTTGFKRSRADFQDLLYQNLRAAGAATSQAGTAVPVGIQLGHGVRNVSVSKLFTQGDYVQTGNELDLAIEGQGFFQITLPDGQTAYTRDGTFKLDNTGQMVTSDGYVLQPGITLPQDAMAVAIEPSGIISVKQPGTAALAQLGQLQVADFINPAGLTAIGRNLYTESEASGAAVAGNPNENGFGAIQQGFLEMSNVNMVEEMVQMIASQRAYELNSKSIQTSDSMLGTIGSLKR